MAEAASHSKHESQYFSVPQQKIWSSMWNRIIGKSNDAEDSSPSQSSRRKETEQRSTRRRSETIASSNTAQKPSRGDDRDRGFHPTSTSYSSTTRNTYPDTASASIASSYATASGNQNGEPYPPPGLVRNASLANQMPKSKAGRGERNPVDDREYKSERRKGRTSSPDRKRDKKERRESRDRDEKKQEKREKPDKKEKDAINGCGLEGVENGYGAFTGTPRGDFDSQIGDSGFMPFPGQTGSGFVGGLPPASTALSTRVPDQFPGQFPTSIAEPYRPPLAVNEGGPGLAADYYGDTGESVAAQPGVRPQQPQLIVGAEPHLQPASSTAAPPPEPSASGVVGAAASFFSGSFESEAEQSSYLPDSTEPNALSSTLIPTRPDNTHHTSSAPVSLTLGAAAAGAAAGYYMDSQSTQHNQRPDHASSINGGQSFTTQRPSSYANGSYGATSQYNKPSKPGKQSSYPSNMPLDAAGAAGLAAAAYHHNHHSNAQHPTSSQMYASGPMAQRHRHRGPLAKLVDFFKDPEGVAQFEEYTEYIGVCRDCFAPGSTPRDAPRKHHFRNRRSTDRFGSNTRVDKDSRYSSSDSEKRRRKKKSWLEAGVAGYGLAKVGESLFNQKHDFDDMYSVKTGHTKMSHAASSPYRKGHTSHGSTRRSSKNRSRRRNSSRERVEIGITSDGQAYKKDSHDGVLNSSAVTRYARHRSKSRSRSRSTDRKISEAAIGAAIGSTITASDARHFDHPTEKAFVRHSRDRRERSPECHRASHRKETKKKKSFFSYSSSPSSSSGEELVFGVRSRNRKSRRRRDSKDDHRKAELAVAGLGAAAAALALNETPQDKRLRRKSDLAPVKESIEKGGRGSEHRRRKKQSPSPSEQDPWESAPDDDESITSDLAYGGSIPRKGSRSSLSSESSETSKWSWRWGGKKKTLKGDRQERHASPGDHHPAIMMHSNTSLPRQERFSVPMSDRSRFDMERHGLLDNPSFPMMTARPGPVPIQHPQPVTPVSPAVYSTRAPYTRAYSAPTGPPVFSQSPYHDQPSAAALQDSAYEAASPFHVPGSFPEAALPTSGPFNGATKASKPRRRDSSPAAYFAGSSGPAAPRRQSSPGDAYSAVRFDLTEEQVEKDRRDRWRQAKEDDERRLRRERRDSEDQKAIGHTSQRPKERTRRSSESKSYEESTEQGDLREDRRNKSPSSDKRGSWAWPVAAASIASVVGAEVVARTSTSDKSDDEEVERRERRRRRRKERDAAAEGVDEMSGETRRKGRSSGQEPELSIWQEVAKTKRSSSHEDYQEFFTPLELVSKAPEYKQVVAEADPDHAITAYEVPDIVTIEPSGFYDSREAPAYAFGPDGEELNSHPSSPSWVPKLKLIAPTPQSSSIAESERGELSPVVRPQDVAEETAAEPPPPITTYEVITEDSQTPEFTIIRPKEHREVIESPTNEELGVGPSMATRKADSSSQAPPKVEQSDTVKATAEFADDIVFAATLAAGLQDAGLDPSIVVEDPSFRRRDSPPGSEEPGTYRRPFAQSSLDISLDALTNETNVPTQRDFVEGELPEPRMPGAFEEENTVEQSRAHERKIGKKEKKKRDKKSKRYELADAPEQGYTGGNGEQRGHLVTGPEPLEPEMEASVGELQGSPEGTPSIEASASVYTVATRGKKSKKKSKRGSLGYGDEEFVLSTPITRDEGGETTTNTKKHRKGSLFGLFGRSKENVSESTATEGTPSVGSFNDSEEPKKRSKKPKARKSTREPEDVVPTEGSQDFDDDSIVKEHKPMNQEKKRPSSDGSSLEESGRITQELSAKISTPTPTGRAPSSPTDDWLTNPEDRDDAPDSDAKATTTDNEPPVGLVEHGQNDGTQAMSFLGVRREVPPPPDISGITESLTGQARVHTQRSSDCLEEGLPSDLNRRSSSPLVSELMREPPSGPASLPTSPTRRSEIQAQRLSELQKADNNHSPLSSPSPTAIPFHFRVPPASPGVARSSPSAPQTSSIPDTVPSRPKLRPRSTEFKSSSEFRPLWLVERHGPKQEPTLEETYPSLPSSHTTSRSSSVRDADEAVSDGTEFFNTTEYISEDGQADNGLLVDTVRYTTEAGLLDSQQTTPTAASFPATLREGEQPLHQVTDSRSEFAPLQIVSENERTWEVPQRSSRPSSPHDSITQDRTLPSLINVTLGAVLGASAAGALLVAKHEPNKPEAQTVEPEGNNSRQIEKKQETSTDKSPVQDINNSIGVFEDYTAALGSSRDLAQDPAISIEHEPLVQLAESTRKPRHADVEPLTAEEQRVIQEQDAQDAVDSWLTPTNPRKSKTDKRGKKKKRSVDTYTKANDALPSGKHSIAQPVEGNDFAVEESALQQAVIARQREENPMPPTSEASEGLIMDMSAEEVVTVMSNAAEATEDAVDTSPSAVQNEGPAIAGEECSVTPKKAKVQSDKKSKKSSIDLWQDTLSEPAAVGADKIITDQNIDEPLDYCSKEEPPVLADSSSRDVLIVNPTNQDTKIPIANDVMLEQVNELEEYLYSTKKGLKGKEKLKQSHEPETEPEAACEASLTPSDDSQIQETGVEIASKHMQPDVESNLGTNFAPVINTKRSMEGCKTLPTKEHLNIPDPAKEVQPLQQPAQDNAVEAGTIVEKAQALQSAPEAASLLSPEAIPLPIEEDLDFLDASVLSSVEEATSTSKIERATEFPAIDSQEGGTSDEQKAADAPHKESTNAPIRNTEFEARIPDTPLQGTTAFGESATPSTSRSGEFGDKDADDFSVTPVKRGKKAKKSKQNQPAENDVVTTPDNLDTTPVTAVLHPADDLGAITHEPESMPEEPPGRYWPAFSKKTMKKGKKQKHVPEEAEPNLAEPIVSEDADVETCQPLVDETEAEGIKPDEVELQLTGLQRDEIKSTEPEPTSIRFGRARDDMETPPPEMQQAETELPEQGVCKADEVEQRRTTDDRSGEQLVAEVREPQNSALQGHAIDLSTSDARKNPAYQDIGIPEATMNVVLSNNPNEKSLPTDYAAHNDDAWEPRFKKKKGKKSKNSGLAEKVTPESVPWEADSEPAAPAVPVATTDATQTVKDILGLSTIDQPEGRAFVALSPPSKEIGGSEPALPETSEHTLERGEWGIPKKKSKKGKKGTKSSLHEDFEGPQNVAANDGSFPLTEPAIAATDTAQGIQDMLESKESEVSLHSFPGQETDAAPAPENKTPTEQAADVDQVEWDVPKKRQGKKGRKRQNIAAEDAYATEISEPVVTPSATEPLDRENEPTTELVEHFATKSKKDKTGKRKQSIPIDDFPTDAVAPSTSALDRDFVAGPSGLNIEKEAPIAHNNTVSSIAPKGLRSPGHERFIEPLALPPSDPVSAPVFQETFEYQVEPSSQPEEDAETRRTDIEHGDLLPITGEAVQPSVHELVVPESTKAIEDVAEHDTVLDEQNLQQEQEPIIVTPSSKKDKKRAKKARGLAFEEETSQPPTEVLSTEIIPADVDNNAMEILSVKDDFEAPPKNKKDRKKAKKSKTLQWENETTTPRFEDPGPQDSSDFQQEPVIGPADTATAAPVEAGDPAFDSGPNTKKDKKRGKKSFTVSRENHIASPEPQERTAVESNRTAENDIAPTQDIVEETPQSIVEGFAGVPKSKKDKEKAKKAKAFGLEGEVDNARPLTDQNIALTRELVEEPEKSVADDFESVPKGKKGKKKGKQAPAFPFGNNVGNALPEDDILGRSKAQEPESELTAVQGDAQVEPEEPVEEAAKDIIDGFESVPYSKAKKSKRSRVPSWVDNAEVSTPGTDDRLEYQRELIAIERQKSIEQESKKPSTESAKDAMEQFGSAAKSKKGRKKATKSKNLSWAGEPDVAMLEPTGEVKPELQRGCDATAPEDPMEGASKEPLTEPTKDVVADFESALKSKKDRKKAKKSKALSGADEFETASLERDNTVQPDPIVESEAPEPQSSRGRGLTEPLLEPPRDVVDDTESSSQSKKAKKKAKKSKALGWSDDTVTSLAQAESLDQSSVEPKQSSETELVDQPNFELEQPSQAGTLEQSALEANTSLDTAEAMNEPAFGSGQYLPGIKVLGQSAFEPKKPLPEAEAFEQPAFGPERHSLRSTVVEQSASEQERDATFETPEVTHDWALASPARGQSVEEPQAANGQSISEAAFPTGASATNSRAIDKASSLRSFEGQDPSEAVLPTEQAPEDSLPSVIHFHTSENDDEPISEHVGPEPELSSSYSLKKSKKYEEKEQNAKVLDVGEETARMDLPSASELSPSTAPTSYEAVDEQPIAKKLDPEPGLDSPYSLKRSRKDKNRAKKAKVLDIEEELAQTAPQVISESTSERPDTEDIPQVAEEPTTATPGLNESIAQQVPVIQKSAYEHASADTSDSAVTPTSTSPEQAHKRSFFEEIGPDVGLEEEKAIEPPSKTKRTDESDPPSQKIMKMEEEAFSKPAKKSKKGKKPKKSAFSDFIVEEAQPSEYQKVPPTQSTAATVENFIPQDEERQDKLFLGEPLVEGATRDFLANNTAATIHHHPTSLQGSEYSAELAKNDDAWNVPTSKGKKDKKKRKGAVRIQSEPDMVESGSRFAPTPADQATQEMPIAQEVTPSDLPAVSEPPFVVPTTEISTSEGFYDHGAPVNTTTRTSEASDGAEIDLPSYKSGQDPPSPDDEASRLSKEQLVKGPSLDQSDENAAFSISRKGKKGKKAQEQQRTVIREDDTATASAVEETNQYADDATVLPPRHESQPSEVYSKKQQPTQDPFNDPGIAEEDLNMTPPNIEYTDLGPQSSRQFNRPDDYSSIPARDDVEIDTHKQLFHPELSGEHKRHSPEYRSYTEDPEALRWEHVSIDPRKMTHEPMLSGDEVGYGAEPTVEASDGYFDAGRYSPEPRFDHREVDDEKTLLPNEQVEAPWGAAPTRKNEKGKDAKKRDSTVEFVDPTTQAKTDQMVGSTDSRSRSTSPVQPADVEDEQMSASRGPSTVEALALAGTLSAGAAVAGGLTRGDSTKRGKRDHESKKGTWARDGEKGISTLPTPYQLEESFDDSQQRGKLGPEMTPPESPVARGPTSEDAGVRSEYSHGERSINRDSAVHVLDSPTISETVPVHRAVRDSGYQDTEASPMIDLGDETRVASKGQGTHLTDPVRETNHEGGRINVQDDGILRPSTASRDALHISMDVDPLYDERSGTNLVGSRSPRTPTPEADLSSGRDTTRLTSGDPREPSPVSSTTKDRSSVLFQSSPSTREAALDQAAQKQSPLYAQGLPDSKRAASPTCPSPPPEARQEPHQSLFGGSHSHGHDVLSSPRSPTAVDNGRRGELDTITEYGYKESSLPKDRRSLSDVGSPERGIKSRSRTGSCQRQIPSPPLAEHPAKDMISTDDIISRLSWPAVEEEKHSVDLDRSRSRTADRQASGRQSVVSASGLPQKPADGEFRSFSGASIRSGESINAIIRTPPDAGRSASGLGYRSSGTPPLRRVDRSVSGDLREANRKSQAKKRAKPSEAEPARAFASSSTYDPTKAKGKGKVRDMADVYVSCSNPGL